MAPRKTRRLLAVFRAIHHPPVAIFGVRPDGQLEESAVRCPEADQIRKELLAGFANTFDWDDRFAYFADRTPRPLTCEVFDVPVWVTPSMLHAIGYLLHTLPYGQAEENYVQALSAYSQGEGPKWAVTSLETMIPTAPGPWEIVPPFAAVLRTFWHLTGELSTRKLRELERVPSPVTHDSEDEG